MEFHRDRKFCLLFSSDFSSHEASYYAEMVKSWIKSLGWEGYWLENKYAPPLDFLKGELDTQIYQIVTQIKKYYFLFLKDPGTIHGQ
jgi:hypothetical protein